MSSALLGILQLDRGEPHGYGQVAGLVQAWLQDAGGFAAVGLVVYLLYALSTPTDKSQSEKLRVPVSRWMVLMGALALISYALVAATFAAKPGAAFNIAGSQIAVEPPPPPPVQPGETPPPEPPVWRTELRPNLLALAGLFAMLGIGEPFARDMLKIARRNLSFGSSGMRRFGQSVRRYAADLLTPNRLIALAVALVLYAAFGAVLFAVGVPQLTGIWIGVLLVAVGVLVCALLLLMLFEAEGPVWAIAKLSFKEAIRSQVLWIFLIMFLPFLFPIQWFSNTKPADEMRATTALVTVILSMLTLIPAVLVTSFGIPNDIKNWNIFTVVSKPIERFEIVLGRFVGYVALMTLVMLALTGVSLVMVTNSSMSDRARAETYKARVPYRGKLEFKSLVAAERQDKKEFTGTNVGREFDYRRYIAGADISPQRAIWRFATVPPALARATDDVVPVEFTFDIFKMTKGQQDKGALTKFQFATQNAPLRQPTKAEGAEWQWVDKAKEREYLKRVEEFKAQGLDVLNLAVARPDNKPVWDAVNKLTEEFGFYEIKGKEVFDYQVMSVEVPAGLFRNALKTEPGKDAAGNPLPRFSVYVKCESEGQMLGAAEPDLYLLQNEMPYALNFLKGMVGLWCRLCIVVGLAVAISTYLSGVLTLLATAFIFVAGFFTDHLHDLATSRNVGGGPFQSMSQLVKAEQATKPLEDSASTKALLFGDKGWAWMIRRLQNMIPDVDSFSWGHFVSEGFNVNTEYLVVNLLITLGYLLPWAVLAYYLMKSREVAA
ncbi:MAG: ABC transporter permease [Planctomycetes bacterium]|nr:ABC transporter permease [Planctomycetota bacterium]